MSRRVLVFIMFLLLVAQFFLSYAASITVKTDKSQYYQGEAVKISGTAPAGSRVAIQVKDPSGSTIFIDDVLASGGTYSTSFKLKSNAKIGTYTVYASCAAGQATTKFNVVSRPGAPPPPSGAAPTGREIANMTLEELEGLLNSTSQLLELLANITDVSEYWDSFNDVYNMFRNALILYNSGDYGAAYSNAARALRELERLWREAVCSSAIDARDLARGFEATGDEDLALIGETMEMLLDLLECSVSSMYVPAVEPSASGVFVLALTLKERDIETAFVVFRAVARLKALADKVKKLKSSVSDLEAKVEALGKENSELKKQIEQAKAQLEEAKKEAEKAVEEYNKLKGVLEQVKSERDSLRARVSELEQEVARLSAEVGGARGTGYMYAAVALIVGFVVGVVVGRVVVGKRTES